MKQISELIDQLAKMPEGKPVSTGIEALDRIGMRFEPGNLYVIGGRPGMGKTSLMLDLALHAAKEENTPVHIFPLAESAEQLAMRLIAKCSELPFHRIERDVSVRKKAAEKCGASFRPLPLFIYDRIHTSPEIIETIQQEKLTGLIFVDYLQLASIATGQYISGKPVCSDEPESIRRNDLGRLLQATARDTNTAIVVLSKVPSKIERRRNKRPKLSDIEYSQYLKADASAVLFLYRDSYYSLKTADDTAEIIVAKNFGGNTGTAYVCFDRNTLSFR